MISTGANLPVVTADTLSSAIEQYRRKTGRPTKFTQETAAAIIERLAKGETLRAICKEEAFPSFPTVYDWMKHIPDFANAIAQARKIQATAMVEEGREIIDSCDDSEMSKVRKAESQAKFRMDMAKCFDRDTYGDKVQQDVNIKGVMVTTTCKELDDLLNG